MRLTSRKGIDTDISNLPLVSWTPTYTSGTGTITSVAHQGAYYRKVGTLVFYSIYFTTSNIGSAGADLRVTLPPGITPNGHTQIGSGREIAVVGKMLISTVYRELIQIINYDNSFPGVSGGGYLVSGWFKV